MIYRPCPRCDDDVKAVRVVSDYEYDTNAGPDLEVDESLSCACDLTADEWEQVMAGISADDIADAQAAFWEAAA